MSRMLKFPSNDERRDFENATFHPSRLTMARELRGMTQLALAMASGVSARTISGYENSKVDRPSTEKIRALADGLGFPTGFFFKGEAPEISAEGVSFRSLARTPAKQRDAVCSTAALAVELDAWIEERFVRPDPDVPDLSGFDPHAAAEAVRSEWGLGVKPIRNAIHLVEKHGVRVYGFATNAESGFDPQNVHALSTWHGEVPFVFVNDQGTAERRRFTVVHELGHLVLHRHGAIAGRQAEREADAFAGAFLVPSADLRANRPRRNLDSIISAKVRWQVAAIALVYRMHEEGLLSDWEYKQLCIRIRGTYGKSEPNEGVKETSQVLTKVLQALREEGFNRLMLARELDVMPETLYRLLGPVTVGPVADDGFGDEKAEIRLRVVE